MLSKQSELQMADSTLTVKLHTHKAVVLCIWVTTRTQSITWRRDGAGRAQRRLQTNLRFTGKDDETVSPSRSEPWGTRYFQ